MTQQMYTAGEYIKKNPTWHIEDSSWKASHILTILKKNNVHPKSICEIGCGAGEILTQLQTKLANDTILTGYEISPQAFELCQQRKNDHLSFHLKDITEEKVHFDVIMAIDVFEHIEDYMGFLKKIREKGKYKVFHIPLDLSAQSVLRAKPLLKKREEIGHIQYFTKDTALATLRDTGYNIVDYYYTATTIDLPAKSFTSLLARIPRKILFQINKDFAVRLFGGYSLIVLAQ
jgi:cyclopropane fatty-acyl-phospholipid synthase-like methyltransferase